MRMSVRKQNPIDPEHLLKLRLCVARFGEMDLAGWWNTKGVLANIGKSVFSRGFPSTSFFAQSRVACAVATTRCQEVFSPPGCFTLWSLTPEIEGRIESSWQEWCGDSDSWAPFFSSLAAIVGKDLLEDLTQLELINNETIQAVKSLRRGAEGKGVALPGHGSPDCNSLMLMAAGFARGEKGKLAVPYLRSDD